MKDLLALNARGLFPGPNEYDAQFSIRASLPPCAPPISLECFAAYPDWIQHSVSSKGLSFWEGAATWEEKGMPIIQVSNSPLLKYYCPDEVIAHESVHAMRIAFSDPHFEEILAYQTSKNRFRRYFGPLFSRPSEVHAFLVVFLLSWIAYFFFSVDAILFAPFFFLICLFGRLIWRQRVFSQCVKQLSQTVAVPALAVILRLNDREIALFAKSSPDTIKAYAQSQTSLRWKVLGEAYFNTSG